MNRRVRPFPPLVGNLAAEKERIRFMEVAKQFADLHPIYVRRLLEAFDTKARSGHPIVGGPILNLLETVVGRLTLRETNHRWPT